MELNRMKLSNYKEICVVKRGVYEGGDVTKGKVDVSSGVLFWKNIKRVDVERTKYNPYWYFKESGEFTPGRQMEKLARAYYD